MANFMGSCPYINEVTYKRNIKLRRNCTDIGMLEEIRRLSVDVRPNYASKFRFNEKCVEDDMPLSVQEWRRVSCFPKLTEGFIDKYADCLTWDYVVMHSEMTSLLLSKYASYIKSNSIKYATNLSDEDIKTYYHLIDWDDCQINRVLPLSVIEYLLSKESFHITGYIFTQQNVSEDWIEKHISRKILHLAVNWQSLSELFIERHYDELDPSQVIEFQIVSESFLNRHWDDCNPEDVLKYQHLSEQFIEEHFQEFDPKILSQSQILSESFIEKHAGVLDWKSLSRFQRLTESFIENHSSSVDWHYIAIYQPVSGEFITKHLIEINKANTKCAASTLKDRLCYEEGQRRHNGEAVDFPILNEERRMLVGSK